MKKLLLLLIAFQLSLFTVNAQRWAAVGEGIKADATGGVYTMGVYNGSLYAAGWFYLAGGDSAYNIARWDGANWFPVGSGLTGGLSNVFALCVYNGKLFAGGAFYAANDSATNDIAVWNGTIWSRAGTGMSTCNAKLTYVNTLAVYNGNLYAGGIFCKAGGVLAQNIAVWNGTKWDSLGSGINGQVNALCVYNGNLYAGGQFSMAGGIAASSIAMWNGSVWAPVAKGIKDSAVLAMAVYNGSLYVGGNFDSAGGRFAKNIAQWNGTAWDSVSKKGITGTSGPGILCTYNSILYAGGYFNNAGGVNVNNIAGWNGVKWDSITGGGTNHLVNTITVYDSTLIIGGEFSVAGGVLAADIAEWGIFAGVDELAAGSVSARLFPNPSHGIFQLGIRNYKLGVNDAVEIYNILGEKIYSSSLTTYHSPFTINISGNPAGIYLYRVIKEDGTPIASGKLVIE